VVKTSMVLKETYATLISALSGGGTPLE